MVRDLKMMAIWLFKSTLRIPVFHFLRGSPFKLLGILSKLKAKTYIRLGFPLKRGIYCVPYKNTQSQGKRK